MVTLACHKRNITAPEAWNMTVADLILTVSEPEKEKVTATDAITQRMICLEIDAQRERYRKLDIQGKAELADWVAKLC